MPLKLNYSSALDLIVSLAGIGVELAEQDKEKIKANVLADKAEFDAEVTRSESLDAPQDEQK